MRIQLIYAITIHHFGVYWPPTRPGCQNRKCTCVNNRCIRSRNNSDAHKKVRVEQLYNLVHRKFNELEIRCGRENQYPERLGPRPPVEQHRRTGKKRYYGQKSGGQYVTLLFGLQLPLTVKPLVTLSNPFK